jgi:hypothetical protein
MISYNDAPWPNIILFAYIRYGDHKNLMNSFRCMIARDAMRNAKG